MRRGLIIILIAIIVAAGAWYWYAKKHQTAPGVPAVTDFSAFFPIGDTGDPTALMGQIGSNTPLGSTDNTTAPTNSPFTVLSASPVAGYTSYTQPTTVTIPADPSKPKSKPTTQTISQHIIRYVSRINGYVYEIVDHTTPLQVSNIFIPNIHEALFADKGNTALLRFVRPDNKTVATYSVPVPPANINGTRTQKQGIYFPDNSIQIASSPDTSQVARILIDSNGSLLSLSTSSNTKKVDLISNPFREWLLTWPSTKNLYLQTKPSSGVPGYLYRVDTSEKKLRRVLGDINGLTTSVSPSGTYILYSQSNTTGFVTKLLNTKTNTTRTLNLALLPEKCAWLANEDLICAGSPSVIPGTYPDDWYQGVTHFSDNLYRIYTDSLIYDTLYDNTSRSYDMTQLSIEETTRNIYFIDKTTGLLWQFGY